MKIIIACYPRVGSRYLNNKIDKQFNPHPWKVSYNEQYQKQLFKNPGFKLSSKQITPLPIDIIENCDNSFAMHTKNFFSPAKRPIINNFILSEIQKHNFQELMLRCDFLQYEHHFDRIINNKLDIRMITLKYETMSKAENINKLKKFLGSGFDKLNFDDFSLRKTDWRNSVFKNEIENVYGALHEKYSELPDIKIWR